MRYAVKGALLSALVWPGLGHVALRRFGRGAGLMIATLAAVAVVAVQAVQYALALLANLETAAGAPGAYALSRAALENMAVSDRTLFHASLAVLILCWIFGVVDAWRVGAHLDRETLPSGP